MKRRWPLRLVQASPLVLLVLLVTVLLAAPGSALSTLLMADAFSEIDSGFEYPEVSLRLEVLRAIAEGNDRVSNEYAAYPGTVTRAASSVARGFQNDPAAFYRDGVWAPDGLDPDNGVAADLRTHLNMTGGSVYAAILPISETPPVAAAIVGDENFLLEPELREYETSGTLSLVREAIAKSTQGGGLDPRRFSLENLNTGQGSSLDAVRSFNYGVREIGGHLYEYIALSDTLDGSMLDMPDSSMWESLDSEEAEQAIARAAGRSEGNLFILGPLDGEPVELMTPDERLRGHGPELLDLYLEYLTTIWGSEGVFAVPQDMAADLGGMRYGAGGVSSVIGGGESGLPSAVVAMVGVYDDHPLIPVVQKRVGYSPLRVAQVWIASNLLFLIPALGVLFLASLAAAPAAFVYERRRISEIEIERERERVQRQAREQVLDRLTHLSNEVDAVAGKMSGTVSREVADVSLDIDATIGALKDILGSAPQANGDSDD